MASKETKPTENEELKVGDHVEWNSRVAHREGHVIEKLTHDRDGTRASEAHPKFIVVDEGRGKEYARNPDKLHKVEDAEEEVKWIKKIRVKKSFRVYLKQNIRTKCDCNAAFCKFCETMYISEQLHES